MQRTLELWTGDAGVSFWAAECSETCKPDSSANGSTSNQFFEEKVCRKPCVQSDGKKDAKSGRNINSIYLRPRLQLPQQQNCPLPSHQLQAELPAVKRSWDYSLHPNIFFLESGLQTKLLHKLQQQSAMRNPPQRAWALGRPLHQEHHAQMHAVVHIHIMQVQKQATMCNPAVQISWTVHRLHQLHHPQMPAAHVMPNSGWIWHQLKQPCTNMVCKSHTKTLKTMC